jgi:uncharacterized protein YjdB
MKKHLYYIIAVILAMMLPLLMACGGSDDDRINVISVTLTPGAATLSVGQTQRLTATILPGNATNTDLAWASSNENIAIVANGTVNALAAGSAIITVTTDDGGKTASCALTVAPAVESVTVAPYTVSLLAGQRQSLTATVLPVNALNKSVTWATDNPGVATVANGTITAIGQGQATITVTTAEGNKSAACLVTVTPIAYPNPVTGVSLPQTLTMLHQDTQFLTAAVLPENATHKAVTWSTSNFATALVINGRVDAVSIGQATITATTVDGGYTASCVVTILPVPVKSISFEHDKRTLGVGYTFRPIFEPANATNKNITLTSSNPDLEVRLNADGTIEPLAAGATTITVTTQDGGFEASCALKVVNVYVSGQYQGYPAVWINTKPQILITQEQIARGAYGVAYSVFVTDSSDVYCAGKIVGPDKDWWDQAVLWKNGEIYMDLQDYDTDTAYGEATSVTVSGDDVYVAGYMMTWDAGRVPRLWKNGVEQYMENVGDNGANVWRVVVSGDDVYAAGCTFNSIYQPTGVLWKNGEVATIIDRPSGITEIYVYGLAVSGDDVYMPCVLWNQSEERAYAALWKNGVMELLEIPEGCDEYDYCYVHCVVVSGENVYAAGTIVLDGEDWLIYWKNGVPCILGKAFFQMKSVAVLDDDVFLASEVTNKLAVWINDGVPYYLTEMVMPQSIFVTR